MFNLIIPWNGCEAAKEEPKTKSNYRVLFSLDEEDRCKKKNVTRVDSYNLHVQMNMRGARRAHSTHKAHGTCNTSNWC